MPDLGFDLAEIARLIRLVETRGLSALVVEEEGKRLVIRGESGALHHTAAHGSGALEPADESDNNLESIAESDTVAVVAPIVGVFYRTPGPDDPPFVEVGDQVESGQTVGLLEAMKVFSEIQVDQAGTIVEIRAKNGELVRSGDCLLLLRPHQT